MKVKKGDIVQHNTYGEIGLVLGGKEFLTLMLKSTETQDFIIETGCRADCYHTIGHLDSFDEMLKIFDEKIEKIQESANIGDIAKNAWGTRGIVVGIIDDMKISVQWKNMEDNALHLSIWDRDVDGVSIIGHIDDVEDLYNGTRIFDKIYEDKWDKERELEFSGNSAEAGFSGHPAIEDIGKAYDESIISHNIDVKEDKSPSKPKSRGHIMDTLAEDPVGLLLAVKHSLHSF